MRLKTITLDDKIIKLMRTGKHYPKQVAKILGINKWRVYKAVQRLKRICQN